MEENSGGEQGKRTISAHYDLAEAIHYYPYLRRNLQRPAKLYLSAHRKVHPDTARAQGRQLLEGGAQGALPYHVLAKPVAWIRIDPVSQTSNHVTGHKNRWRGTLAGGVIPPALHTPVLP